VFWPSAVVSFGEAMATVGEHDCGWGVLRLRVNGLCARIGTVSGGEVGPWNRILTESVLAPFHGSRPALGHQSRAIRLCTWRQ
jgi:hypothetical protein